MTAFPIHLGTPVEHAPDLPERADVVIIGGGVIGVATAYYLARAGHRPVLLEKGRIAGEQSSRNWGWIRQMGRDLAELPIMIEANRLWRDIAADVDTDIGLTQCGLTYFSSDPAETARYEAWLAEARPMGVDSRILSGDETARMIPGMSRSYDAALHTPSDMRAEPWVAVPALARAAVRHGAVIVENCAARVIDREAGRVAGVVTEKGRIKAQQVVVAGGAWSALFLRNEGIAIPQLSVRASVAATDPVANVHDGGGVDRDLAFRRRQDGGYSLASAGFHELFIGPDAFRNAPRFLPELRRSPGNRRFFPWAPQGYPDAWRTPRRWQGDTTSPFEALRILNPSPNLKKIEDVRRRFAALFPALGEVRIRTAWAGMIDTMPDVVPVVDRAADLPGLSICTGMCGHGFGIGPGFGRIMADMVTGRDPGHDLTRFRLNRFSDGSSLVLGPDL
ncbi:NAD(P)/FAD-dependent oxidoreductase [Shimia biformata]|uniref:NAD(P)/FAD-dependent oxidoreductase n=1 Tax=Shimia biformata TaxID=1294299 RepID=UPI00194EE9BF|nr:FAD-binding oxidoreductase [Shimia biformata]